MRQKGFDSFQTTDDHGMQITGIYKDQNGNKFYKVKNSWDAIGKYDGYFSLRELKHFYLLGSLLFYI